MRNDGQWLLASVREFPDVAPGTGVHLQPLAWLIGVWQDDEAVWGEDTGSVEFAWAPRGNYILARHAIGIGDRIVSEGDQRIGWDTATGEIRSWSEKEAHMGRKPAWLACAEANCEQAWMSSGSKPG